MSHSSRPNSPLSHDRLNLKQKLRNNFHRRRHSEHSLSPDDLFQLNLIERELSRRRKLVNRNLSFQIFDSGAESDYSDHFIEDNSSIPKIHVTLSPVIPQSRIERDIEYPTVMQLLRFLHLEQDFDSRRSSSADSREHSYSDSAVSLDLDLELDDEDSERSSGALPISILYPEFLERQKREEDALRDGCYFVETEKRKSVRVARERLDYSVKMARERMDAGLKDEDELGKFYDTFRIAFHTADSFDSMDQTK